MILRALKDCQRGGEVGREAAAWLYSCDAALILAALDLPTDPESIGAAIEAVLDGPAVAWGRW